MCLGGAYDRGAFAAAMSLSSRSQSVGGGEAPRRPATTTAYFGLFGQPSLSQGVEVTFHDSGVFPGNGSARLGDGAARSAAQ
jgi:hypothetical protein